MRMATFHQSTEFYLPKHLAAVNMIYWLNELFGVFFSVWRGTCEVSSSWLMLDVRAVRLLCSELPSGQGRSWCSCCPQGRTCVL